MLIREMFAFKEDLFYGDPYKSIEKFCKKYHHFCKDEFDKDLLENENED
jgi:hypothetical protein